MKNAVSLCLLLLLHTILFAQAANTTDAAKAKEIQAAIVELLAKSDNNFEGMSGAEYTKAETYAMYAATPTPKMHAQNYYITHVNASKANFYVAYYTRPEDIALAKAAIMALPKLEGAKWEIATVSSADNNASSFTQYLYYKGAAIGQLRDDWTAKSFGLSLGLFKSAPTVANASAPTLEHAKPASGETAQTKEIQAAIADLVVKASNNFEGVKGPEQDQSLYSTMYKTTTATKLYAQASYINYCKANGKSYFMAYYMCPKEDFDIVVSAFVNMPTYGGSKWKFEQVKKEDKYDDKSYFVNLAYLYYDGVKVAELRKNEREDVSAANFYLLSIGLFDKPAGGRPAYNAITHPAESYRSSTHLTVSNNIISVKNWGSKFDGEYDVTKLAKDSCVSGNCNDGHGRKVLATVSNNIPRIRIMEGKFKNNVFLGDGDMLIDGESPVVDGTYELGKFKVSYTHNTLQSSAIFHPRDYNEAIEGDFSGYLDDGIGKALPEYQKFVVCEFHPSYDDKKKDASKWRQEISGQDRDLGRSVFSLSKEYSEAYNKLKPSEDNTNYSNNASSNNAVKRSGATAEKLNIRRTCGACGGTGKIYHNVTEYTYSGSSRIATSRRVPETCGACHGSGYL